MEEVQSEHVGAKQSMLTVKLDKDPYDERVLFTGKTTRSIPEGLTVLVGANGTGKTTTLDYIKEKYGCDNGYKVLSWSNTRDKGLSKDRSLMAQDYSLLSALAFSSEGEEINTNIGMVAQQVGREVRNPDKNLIILLDGMDSGLSIDNIAEAKDFFHEYVLKDMKEAGKECYIIVTANEYELARGERCVDARSGKEVSFKNYEEYRAYIMDSRKKKDASS